MTFRAAFYKGTRPGLAGLYNRLVRWWTVGQYSHVELVFDSGVSASSSFADGGVRFKEIDYDPTRWDFINLPDAMELPALIWFHNHAGAKYDALANIRYAFGFVQQDNHKWMCAEAVMTALGYSDGWRFEPNSAASVLRQIGQ